MRTLVCILCYCFAGVTQVAEKRDSLPDDQVRLERQSPPPVPAAAVQAAQKCLVQDWMVRCKAEPAFYGLDEKTDLAAAVLEVEPFVEYVVGGNQLRQFAASSSVDPREFASLTKYTFPILIHGEYKGGLVIVGNLDGDGNVIRAAMPPGAYVCSEFLGPNGWMEEYRRRIPLADGYNLSFVSFDGHASAILVTDRSNALFVLEGEVLTPIADAGKKIRDSAVAALNLESLASNEAYDPLQHAQLIIRGTVLGVDSEQILMSEWGMADKGMEESTMMVTYVRVAVTSVLRGEVSERKIVFGANGGLSPLFDIGHEYIVCAKWRDVGDGGIYVIGPDIGLYRRAGAAWTRVVVETLTEESETLTDEQVRARIRFASANGR